MRRRAVVLTVTALIASAAVAAPASTAAPAAVAPAGPSVFVGDLSTAQLLQVKALGVDREDLTTGKPSGKGAMHVEAILDRQQVKVLQGKGVRLTEKKVEGKAVSLRAAAANAAGHTVFRPWSGPGNLHEEWLAGVASHPGLAKVETIGHSITGQDLIAVKVTSGARRLADGKRPAVLYIAAQHAREWITPEMNRRLFHYFLDNYATDPKIHHLLDTTEVWFVPVANPDGYDFTFTQNNRLWRKNLRDVNGDGVITSGDGVDPNRNFGFRWGYDNEGSSPVSSSQTYRGSGPQSEPETQGLDSLAKRLRFKFTVNYHSAAELLLYGVGWQVSTASPDDVLSQAMAGTPTNSAIPGYNPEQAAQLYTTNGETDEDLHNRYGTVAYTPEMATCETASGYDPNDAFDPADCGSVFEFPDSEALVAKEFTNNIPFALSVAESAVNPSHPVSSLGLTAPDFDVDSFAVSYGDPQTVAVTARRELHNLQVHWKVAGGREKHTALKAWKGGERYGREDNTYYAEYRAEVAGAKPGQKVEVWFTGDRVGHGAKASVSKPFTYTLAQDDDRAKVVVIADEDYNGVNPTYNPPLTGPKYAQQYLDALKANGVKGAVWDVSKQGVPHPLGVLSHFKGAVWYDGDNRLTQDPEDEVTDTPLGPLQNASVAEREQYLTVAVRDYLNEGGKLLATGEDFGYYGVLGSSLGGIYYGLKTDPAADCVVTTDFFADCLLLADDFRQYYLGAYARSTAPYPSSLDGVATPLTGLSLPTGGAAAGANPLDQAGVFTVTSDILPVAEFPQFASHAAAAYGAGSGPGPFSPVEGSWYVGSPHADDAYMRLTRTVDLTGVAASATPTLHAQLSYDTEPGYDNVIVEAHTVGQDDWTTLADANGHTDTGVPLQCEEGFLVDEHPWLAHYLTVPPTAAGTCTPTGTSGSWNRMTANSGGWVKTAFDLSGFAGKQVEVSISYVSDPGTGGVGVFVDDTSVTAGGATVDSEGFETGLGPWALPAPPPGSPTATLGFRRSQALVAAAVATDDSLLLGLGLEQLATPAAQASAMKGALKVLLSK